MTTPASRWPKGDRSYGSAWRRLRLRILERDAYLCQCPECKAQGRIREATEVNHVTAKAHAKAKGWTAEQIDAESNLQAVNKDCHARITIQQRGHTPRPIRRIGLDGYPVEDTPAGGEFKT